MIGAMIIAVDGSAASGKGTLSKRLADHFNLAYLDTGSLFRALALQLLNAGTVIDDIDENQPIEESTRLDVGLCNAPEIRTDRVASLASKVAILPEVRTNLLTLQRNFANDPPHGNGAVLDGRDIGSVVVPETPIKFFIDAKLEVRAERRFKELLHADLKVIPTRWVDKDRNEHMRRRSKGKTQYQWI